MFSLYHHLDLVEFSDLNLRVLQMPIGPEQQQFLKLMHTPKQSSHYQEGLTSNFSFFSLNWIHAPHDLHI